jgi:uncharacterized membrane protein
LGWKPIALWILQIFLGVYFIFVGINHFILPDGLPSMMNWMYELSDTTHAIAGTAEILGGLGLILPSVTRIRPELTVYAAIGLIGVMVGAIIWHITRGEASSLVTNVFNVVLLATVAYGRAKAYPIEPKSSAA